MAHIRLTNQVWAQSNAYIKAIGITAYGQSLAQIKQTYPFGGGGAILAQDDFSPDYANLNGNPADIGGNYSVYYNDSSGTVLRSLSGHLRNSASGAGRSYYRVGTGTDGDTDHLLTWDITADGYGGLWLRGTGGNNFYCLDFGYRAEVDSTLYRRTAGVLTVLASYNIDSLAGTDTRVRISVSGVSSTSLKVRYWDQSGAEPETWAINTTDNTAGNQIAAGAFGIWGRLDTWADYSADDYLVTEIGSGVQGPTFAQAQTQVSIPIIVTVRVYAQALADIKTTYLVYAQAQAKIILSALKAYGQSQTKILTTYQGYAQANTKIILSALLAYAQAGAIIKKTYLANAQAQAQIKTTYLVYAQAQVTIEVTTLVYAQAQSKIIQTYRAYAQAQVQVKAVTLIYAQSMGYIKSIANKAYAQAPSWIKQTYPLVSVGTTVIAQDDFNTLYSNLAGNPADIGGNWSLYWRSSGNATISTTDLGFGGLQFTSPAPGTSGFVFYRVGDGTDGDSDHLFTSYANGGYLGGVWARGVSSNTSYQCVINGDTLYINRRSNGTQVTVTSISGTFNNNVDNIRVRFQVIGNSPTILRARAWVLTDSEPQTWLLDTTDNTAINQISGGAYGIVAYRVTNSTFAGDDYSVEGTGVVIVGPTFAQSQAKIKSINNSYAQSQAKVITTYSAYAQSNTYIKTVGLQVFAQGQARIKQTYTGWAQANAYIRLSELQVYGQSQATVKTTYQGYSQAQAKLNAFNVQNYAQAMVWIEGSFTQFAQSQAKLNAFAVKAYGQTQTWIKAPYATFAQAQTQVKSTYLPCAQAQANIKATSTVYAQVQASIKTTYQAYAQAQSKIILSALQVYGQAQTQVKTSYVVYAQANARIIMVGLSVYAQTQAQIKATYQVFAQANTYVKVTGNVTFAQAQTRIKTTYVVYAQAQGVILASYRGYAQAQSRIIVRDIEAYAQAGATIRAIGQGYSQAEVWIYIPQIARPIADISNDGNWVGTVRD